MSVAKKLKIEESVGTAIIDIVLRAQASLSEAERAYYEQIVAYNKAITYLHLSTGTLLEVNNVHLAEGGWDSAAYGDAELRAVSRTHARPNQHLDTLPREFVSPGPAGSVELRTRAATPPKESDELLPPEMPEFLPPISDDE